MRHIVVTASLLALAACGFNGTDRNREDGGAATAPTQAASDNLADTMASHDGAKVTDVPDIADPQTRPEMQLQVVLDRLAFGPGVIDGRMGMSTVNALNGFQQANGLPQTGKLDDATKAKLAQWSNIPATRVVRIPESWGTLDYQKTPAEAADQARLKRLGYQNLDEKLAERFHTTIDVLKMLNPGGQPAGMTAQPGATPTASSSPSSSPTPTPSASASGSMPDLTPPPATFKAGQLVRVPNIGGDRIAPGAVNDPDWQQTLVSLGVGTEQPKVARVVVSKSKSTLQAFDSADKLVAEFTVSSGSSEFPLPIGNWKILGIAHNPPFAYDPAVLTGGRKDGEQHELPPGPNGPVGVVWIDLSKEHYGIHGTPDPSTIGRAQSHGCVRLTNWDAARLAQMVSTSTKVEFIK